MDRTSVLIISALVAGLAVFHNYPAPELSPQLKEWQDTGKFFKFNGHNIFYKDEGSKENEDVLVIFHGFPTCGHDFHKIWDGLTSQFGRVIMPDFLGYGFSDKPADHYYSLFDKADMIEALLATLGVSKIHILAHDMGSTVAQELIHRQNKVSDIGSSANNKVEIISVCLSNGGIIPETIQQRLLQKILLKPYLGALAPYLNNRFLFKKGFGEVFGKLTQPTAEEFSNHWALIRHNDGNRIPHLLINYLRERYINRDRWVHALSDTAIPLHIIFGPSDPVNPKDPFLSTYKKLVPNSGVSELEPHISHYPQLEAPKEYLQAYLQFFKSLKKS
ncbi:mesoderm-specific transcript homolog protein-like [Lytechinus pictus]|uniref:mesoderm-specific transcript homolog protein-like n=1 Tax=Lytechinus pictus TaxID=7653 RepID=UPI00240E2DED|nr:mesoderm-specific transcript homolog protein-like [Lytechinus pictus]